MNRLGSETRRGLKRLEAMIGSPTFRRGSTDYPCTPSLIKRGTSIVLGGIGVEVNVTLFVRRDLLSSAPKAGVEKFIYNGTTYRVLSVGAVPGDSHYEIDLGDPNR